MKPSVAIVVLNWNQRDLTLDCLRSLSELDYPNYFNILVDNGSNDGTYEAVQSQFPDTKVIKKNMNLGFAEGNNVGIRYALREKADYILILNNDTIVEPSMLSTLVNVANSHPDIGMVGPAIFYDDPPGMIFSVGSYVKWAQGTIEHRGMREYINPIDLSSSPEPADFLVGCGVLVSKQCLEAIGLLNNAYYLNYEDVEWGIKAWRHGFRVLCVTSGTMWHKVSASLGRASPANTYYMTRNSLLFFWRNAPSHIRLLSVSRILLRTLRTIAAWTLKSQYHNQPFQRKRDANLMALRDFFLGRFNKMGSDVAKICYSD